MARWQLKDIRQPIKWLADCRIATPLEPTRSHVLRLVVALKRSQRQIQRQLLLEAGLLKALTIT